MPGRVAAQVRKRDRVCRQCGATENLEVDHVVPVVEARLAGWTDTDIDSIDNGQLLCKACHAAKTRGEQARGQARRRGVRPARRHPGLIA